MTRVALCSADAEFSFTVQMALAAGPAPFEVVPVRTLPDCDRLLRSGRPPDVVVVDRSPHGFVFLEDPLHHLRRIGARAPIVLTGGRCSAADPREALRALAATVQELAVDRRLSA
jgi:hypothetical protein